MRVWAREQEAEESAHHHEALRDLHVAFESEFAVRKDDLVQARLGERSNIVLLLVITKHHADVERGDASRRLGHRRLRRRLRRGALGAAARSLRRLRHDARAR